MPDPQRTLQAIRYAAHRHLAAGTLIDPADLLELLGDPVRHMTPDEAGRARRTVQGGSPPNEYFPIRPGGEETASAAPDRTGRAPRVRAFVAGVLEEALRQYTGERCRYGADGRRCTAEAGHPGKFHPLGVTEASLVAYNPDGSPL